MIIEVDNTNCSVPIESINMNVTNTVGLRSAQSSTADTHHVFGKRVPGLPAGTKMVGNEAIKEGFKLLTNSELKPTCSGKLLSSHFDLSISLGYDVACDCCSSVPVVSLRIVRHHMNLDDFPEHKKLPAPNNLYSKLGSKDDAYVQLHPSQHI